MTRAATKSRPAAKPLAHGTVSSTAARAIRTTKANKRPQVDTTALKQVEALVLGLPLIEGELLRRSFHAFVKAAWPILEPGTPLKDNWHLAVICDHLEAISRGEIQRLIINMPPRFAKSMLVSVLWPAWTWANFPEKRFLTGSYAKDLATRDAVAARRLMESHWYRQRFGHVFSFTSDQNVKTRYENSKRGYRVATSVGSAATGEGGDILLVDDPVSAMEAHSEVVLKGAITWWRETMSTRYNDPKTGAAVIVMQRLHEEDLTGYLLKSQPQLWEHLVLPMRFEPKAFKTTKLGFKDPRKVEGELLFPNRFDEEATKRLEVELGSYGAAGQLQQRPAPAEGGIFKRKDWRFYKVLPELDEIILTADCAFKGTDTSDYVAIQAWGRKGANKYLLPGRINEQMGFAATVKALVSLRALYPQAIATLIEDKANGSAVIETLTTSKELSGVLAIEPEGGKVARAWAMQPEQEAGNIWLPDPELDPTIETYINTCASFPVVANDDEVDAMTQAINWWKKRLATQGLQDYMKELAEQAAQPQAPSQKQSPHDFMRAMS